MSDYLNTISIVVLSGIAIIQTFRLSYLAGRLDHHRETLIHVSHALEVHQKLIMFMRRDVYNQDRRDPRPPLGDVLHFRDYEREEK